MFLSERDSVTILDILHRTAINQDYILTVALQLEYSN